MISLVLEAVSNFILLVIQKIGYLGIFFLMILQSFNVPIPSEITMPFSGFLAQRGIFNFWLVVLVGTVGNLAGAVISYYLAVYLISEKIRNKYRILRILFSDARLDLAQKWFKKYGVFSVFFSRMVPVMSTFISFPAGLARMKISVFMFLTFLGSFIWCLFLTYLGFFLGENWTVIGAYFREFDYLILIFILTAAIWWLWRRLHSKNEVSE